MEFTEISEINEMITYARSLRPTNGIESLRNVSKYDNSTYNPKDSTSNDVYEYEKLLLDSPPNRLDKLCSLLTLDTIFNNNEREDIEEIIKEIQETIDKKVSTLILNEDKKKVFTEYQSETEATTNNSLDNSFVEEKISKENSDKKAVELINSDPKKNFEKLDEELVSKSYCEAKNMKSFLSSGLTDFPKVKICIFLV